MSDSSRQVLADVALLVLLAAAAVAIGADLQPVRPFVVFTAACLVPGGAALTRLRTGEALTDLALAFGLSCAIVAAGALLAAWSGWWHPVALGVLLGAASAGLLIDDLAARAR